jgi:CRISPR-associated protein Cas5h
MEFLKDSGFEVYFHHGDGSLMDRLSERLMQHRMVYTPYLGITECIANFEFLWDREVHPFEGVSNVLSAFRLSYLKTFKLGTGTGIVRERVPFLINAERERLDGDEVVFNPHAGPILAEIESAYLYPGENDKTIAFIG